MDQAEKTGAIVRGHTLVWHSQLPPWVQNITDAEDLKSVMKGHIDAVLGRYGDRLAHMDVVNERTSLIPLDLWTYLPFSRLGQWYFPRQCLLQPPRRRVHSSSCEPSLSALTECTADKQFQYAHEAAPNLKLYINDYNIESMNNKSMVHAQLAKSLLDANVPIDGVGFQCHFIGGSVPEDLAETMAMFTDMGLEVALTELDVRVPVNNRGLANSTWLDIQ